ncbi:glutamate-5-semialdehyde dehydrogenase [Sporolactobacillus shoreicorticis]|uniref:Gamma-glutamyl phosphate reductase n=1 Tax=Sporolactobacillus shoreicorticis TaxID=1923877 RepID=A0ABW5S083_9BACL|nr:glutamate-5-semialdehyde dehydrogenase [Sporolactobacillus shoreicorticis]MCO7126826.1 glutamate-5-semialdehyde dehydrogenase [Sporolactobacillus shoreicorticis]
MNDTKDNELIHKAELAHEASQVIAAKSTEEKNSALNQIADSLRAHAAEIIAANQQDMLRAQQKGMTDSLLDRLMLNKERIFAMANALEHLANLADPIGDELENWDRPNGLTIKKIRVPIGVIGMVYEARPNVTVDAAGLCLKTGNAVYLRGSASALDTNKAIVAVIRAALNTLEFPADSVQLLEDTSHETAGQFFRLNGLIDVLIPRGSSRLIQTVIKQASIPVLETGAGNCHVFIDETAKPEMAISIVLNAKTQRPSVCNTIETVIIHQKWFDQFGSALLDALQKEHVSCRIDPIIAGQFPDLKVATEEDWATEYLDKIIAVKIVSDLDEAIRHINKYGTKHSESIVTENAEHVATFFKFVDASTLYHNASTRFTDGEEFGFGAEIGISTQKLHARGPMGLNALTSIKYLIEGNGQIRH